MTEDNEARRIRTAYTSMRTFDERRANRGFRKLTKERDKAIAKLLPRLNKPLSACRVLDFGCGIRTAGPIDGRVVSPLGVDTTS